jgi:hypothetical protein
LNQPAAPLALPLIAIFSVRYVHMSESLLTPPGSGRTS